MKKKLFALSSALLLTVSLAACGSDTKASGNNADQSVDEACSVVTTEFKAFSEKYSSIVTEVASDPEKSISALEDLKTDLDNVTNKISNAEVLTAWDSLVAGFNHLVTAASSEDTTELTSAINELTEGTNALAKICPATAG